jgi:hypothetical protein
MTGAVLVLASSLAWGRVACATPSSTIWTNMTPDIQPYGILHIGVDDYFTAFRKTSGGSGAFPTDAGLTIGLLRSKKVQMEAGIDLLGQIDYPVTFNVKLGAPEGALFSGSPLVALGVFNIGTKRDVTNQNVVCLTLGKAVTRFGRLSAGPYVGNRRVLVDPAGRRANSGFMAAFDRGVLAVRGPGDESFNRLVLAADYASGRNALGGGALGLYYFFHSDVSLLVGPVWFREEAFNGKGKWTIQLDVNKRLFGH